MKVESMVNVIKWDGRTEPFQKEKVQSTLLRLGAPPEAAEELALHIQAEAYEDITTTDILEMVYEGLERYAPAVALQRDLRTALGEIRPSDFEEYVRIVLRAHGYRVTSNRVIQGFCVTHEIDGIAEKDGATIYLEVKHHADLHNYTPFSVTLAAKAKWDDIKEGFGRGLNRQAFDRVLIVCNTRLTEHAKRYAACIGIDHIGWNTPYKRGLDALVRAKKLFPTTILKKMTPKERNVLTEAGIITLKQMVNKKPRGLDLPKARWTELLSEAKRILA